MPSQLIHYQWDNLEENIFGVLYYLRTIHCLDTLHVLHRSRWHS